MTVWTKAFAAPAVLAAASLVAMPAAATELPTSSHITVAPVANQARIGIGWGSGWGWGGRHHRHHRHRGSTAGDILPGVLILGTIAAVASAASKANDRRDYPVRYPYPDPRGEYRPDYRADGPQGLEGAANLCLREVERNARAREVSRVERNAGGWLVAGAMADGSAFSCSIGADGRIDRVEVGGSAQTYGDAGTREDDDRYRSARAEGTAAAQPAYPGGPLPGEDPEALPEAPASED